MTPAGAGDAGRGVTEVQRVETRTKTRGCGGRNLGLGVRPTCVGLLALPLARKSAQREPPSPICKTQGSGQLWAITEVTGEATES